MPTISCKRSSFAYRYMYTCTCTQLFISGLRFTFASFHINTLLLKNHNVTDQNDLPVSLSCAVLHGEYYGGGGGGWVIVMNAFVRKRNCVTLRDLL